MIFICPFLADFVVIITAPFRHDRGAGAHRQQVPHENGDADAQSGEVDIYDTLFGVIAPTQHGTVEIMAPYTGLISDIFVSALDLGSSILGCESSSLSFRTMFLSRTKTHPNLELGYRQAVRHQVLILATYF